MPHAAAASNPAPCAPPTPCRVQSLGTSAWVKDATLLEQLKPKAEDAEFRGRWRAIKQQKKEELAAHIKQVTGYTVPTDALFDVHVSRACVCWGGRHC